MDIVILFLKAWSPLLLIITVVIMAVRKTWDKK
jgi:hypothetical protein